MTKTLQTILDFFWEHLLKTNTKSHENGREDSGRVYFIVGDVTLYFFKKKMLSSVISDIK